MLNLLPGKYLPGDPPDGVGYFFRQTPLPWWGVTSHKHDLKAFHHPEKSCQGDHSGQGGSTERARCFG